MPTRTAIRPAAAAGLALLLGLACPPPGSAADFGLTPATTPSSRFT